MNEQCFVSAALLVKNDKILLLHRSVGFRVWEFPGGGIEFGESPEKAAEREANEETGLTVKSAGLLGVFSHVTPQKKHHIWFLYRCKILGDEERVADDDHDKKGWFTLKEMESLPDLALSVKDMLPKLKGFLFNER